MIHLINFAIKNKTVTFISFLAIVALTVLTYKVTVKKMRKAILPDKVIEAPYGDKVLYGEGWDLVSIVCKRGGFDILGYAGEEITVEQSLAFGKFYGIYPLAMMKMYMGNKMICEYYVQDSCILFRLYPGIFPINDPHIRTIM
jgi:hypothetical protein